jgi:hypothetical protein
MVFAAGKDDQVGFHKVGKLYRNSIHECTPVSGKRAKCTNDDLGMLPIVTGIKYIQQ